MIKVKVFSNTNNALPSESTPFSAAKDIRAELALVSDKFMFDAIKGFVNIDVETGFVEEVYVTAGQVGRNIVACLVIQPNGRVLIPSGLFVEIPNGYSMDVRPRSGLALKYGLELVNSPGLIDPDYRGDVGIIVKNGGSKPIIIVDGDRIGQLKLVKDVEFEWEEVESKDDLVPTQRGDGGFNSTGTK